MSESNFKPTGGCRPIRQEDLKPWEKINERGQLEIDLQKAEENGFRLVVTRLANEDDEAEYSQDILPGSVQGGKYIANSPRQQP
jgi:hypothetical protein